MTNEEFRKALKAVPFVPFRVYLASGRVLDVKHPDYALCPPDRRIAVIYNTEDEAYDNVDLLLVESIEFKTHGHKRGRGKAA